MTEIQIRPWKNLMVSASDGAIIAGAEWSGSRGPLVCIHGITSQSRAFVGLASELADYKILAIDCRGRGDSSKRSPFGLRQHAADVVAAMDSVGVDRAVLVGHSMGAYVASAVTSEYPERVESVIFIDGGFWRDYPLTMSPDELLDLRLGPFLAKFRRRWNSIDEYLDYYRNTPVYPTGIDAYGRVHFEYDLAKLDNKLVAKISEECVRTDWRDVVDHDTVGKRLEQVRVPALLLTAPQGLTGTGDEVITPRVRAELELRIPQLRTVEIPDSNHHTILLSKAGASTVANEIAAFAG